MTGPLSPADQAAATASAIADNAERLGLIWRLRPATVIDATTLTVDGDTEPIAWTDSLIGPAAPDQRVWVATVPPSGNYIVGHLPLPTIRWSAVGLSLLGGVDNFVAPTAVQENIGGWSINSGTAYVTVPLSGRYAITCTVNTNTPGVANSRQAIILDVTTTITPMSSSYRNFWADGEMIGTLTIAPLTLNKGDSMRVNFRQNSIASMPGSVYLTAARMGDI